MYTYRGLPSNIVPDEKLWCVSGIDALNKSAGILEWCYNETDAKQLIKDMRASDQFCGLSANLYVPVS